MSVKVLSALQYLGFNIAKFIKMLFFPLISQTSYKFVFIFVLYSSSTLIHLTETFTEGQASKIKHTARFSTMPIGIR